MKKILTTHYHQILCELLLETAVVTYIYKNVNLSNERGVSKGDLKPYSRQYVLDGRLCSQNDIFKQ